MSAIDNLKQHYPDIIADMKSPFTSHEFILMLARSHQGLYIKFLAEYADNESPFMSAHGQLAKLIGTFEDLVERDKYVSSKDIFGNSNDAMKWHKK